MVIISHRGNLDGRKPGRENKPDYIQEALDAGYDVEIDVWMINNELFLGHDGSRNQDRSPVSIQQPPLVSCQEHGGTELHVEAGVLHCFFHKMPTTLL